MSKLNIEIVDRIVETCFHVYNKTPKSGKPVENEWTVLSCIVKYDILSQDIEVISLGTGSKCVGTSKMSPNGSILNDSHAEVFARRGFLLYLYENIKKCLKQESSVFNYTNGRFELRKNTQFIFYSSQLPCGDASIIPKSENDDVVGDIIKLNHKSNDFSPTAPKQRKLDVDIHRTGAKCLPNTEQDLKEPGMKYHTIGVVRTKPGRGDKTLSVSCSDKIARWTHLGIQGSFLSLLCSPIYIAHYIFGAGTPYSEETLHRAILKRNNDSLELKPEITPVIYQTSLQFQNLQSKDAIRPSAGSIVWINLQIPICEVAVQGKKLGVTKKNALSPINSLCISKYNLYRTFLDILENDKVIKTRIINNLDINSVPYNEMKKKTTGYLKQWSEVKNKFFKTWTVKPDMWDFCINKH